MTKHTTYILGAGVLIILIVVGVFIFGRGTASYIASIDSDISNLEEDLVQAKSSLETGAMTPDEAVIVKNNIHNKLASINDSVASVAKNTQLTQEQRQQIAAALMRMKQMLEQYVETLSAIDTQAQSSTAARSGNNDGRLVESFNHAVQSFEDHVDEIEDMARDESENPDSAIEGDNEESPDGVEETNNEDVTNGANTSAMTLGAKTWDWIQTTYDNGDLISPNEEGQFTITFNEDGTFSATTDCNGVGGSYTVFDNSLSFSEMVSTQMYCEGSREAEFIDMLQNTDSFTFASDDSLILQLQNEGRVILQ